MDRVKFHLSVVTEFREVVEIHGTLGLAGLVPMEGIMGQVGQSLGCSRFGGNPCGGRPVGHSGAGPEKVAGVGGTVRAAQGRGIAHHQADPLGRPYPEGL